MKQFNLEGVCSPKDHYMVDTSTKAGIIIDLIDDRKYITISRPRQYGKTNMLSKLRRTIREKYYVLSMSFGSSGKQVFNTEQSFVEYLTGRFADLMEAASWPQSLIQIVKDHSVYGDRWAKEPFPCLAKLIDRLCSAADRGIVLMIDEADRIANNDVLLSFLGVLRENYLARQDEREASFQSVILAGVTDIRNLKDKIRSDEEHDPNSPWNIAVDCNADMSFSPEETADMLREYETDHQTGMDISAVSLEIRRLTSGYPYIVSWICWCLDKSGCSNWTVEGVQAAGKAFLRSNCTLLQSVRGKLQRHKDLLEALTQLLYYGGEYEYDPPQPSIEIGIMYGILSEGEKGRVVISNLLFRDYISRFIIGNVRAKYLKSSKDFNRSEFLLGDGLDMVRILDRFQAFLTREHKAKDDSFIEREGRLIFLGYLDPIINGTGHTYVEPETQNEKRMDVVVSYGSEEYIVELKIWDGPEYRREGIKQLEGYMSSREANVGYLISFNFQKTDRSSRGWLSFDETGKQIYEIIIQLGK